MRSHHSWQKDEEALGCMHAMITGVLHLVCFRGRYAAGGSRDSGGQWNRYHRGIDRMKQRSEPCFTWEMSSLIPVLSCDAKAPRATRRKGRRGDSVKWEQHCGTGSCRGERIRIAADRSVNSVMERVLMMNLSPGAVLLGQG